MRDAIAKLNPQSLIAWQIWGFCFLGHRTMRDKDEGCLLLAVLAISFPVIWVICKLLGLE